MAFKNIVTLLVLCAIVAVAFGQSPQGGPHTDQGGPHHNQGRVRRQLGQEGSNQDQSQEVDQEDIEESGKNIAWTSCDVTQTARLTCHDCSTRLICKPIGGILKVCRNPQKPYCNNGICSPVPSTECN